MALAHLRRLPLVLRLATLVGVLIDLVVVAIALDHFVPIAGFLIPLPDAWLQLDGASPGTMWFGGLIALGLACTLPASLYNQHSQPHRPDGPPSPWLATPMAQARLVLLLVALPLIALAVTLLAPYSLVTLDITFALEVLAFVWIFAVYIALASRQLVQTRRF